MMPKVGRKSIALRLLGLVLGVAGGLAIWPAVQLPFAAFFCGTANVALAGTTFGGGGHSRLHPEEKTVQRPGDNMSSDARVVLSVDGFEGELGMGLSLLREVYMPLVVFVAAIGAAPLSSATKACALLLGAAAALVLSLAALWLQILWTFSRQMTGVYQLGRIGRSVVDMAYRTFLVPPGIRIAGALGMAAAVVFWQFHRPSSVEGARRLSSKERM
jgi:hypothetical protein